MAAINFKEERNLNREQVFQLYTDAEWYAYTNDMEKLLTGIQNSLYVLTAWQDEKLVGLVRVVGDGNTIAYIQDILVLKASKRQGIGRQLLQRVFEKFKHVRQKVLLTDDSAETRGFYESLGMVSCDKGETVAFMVV